MIRPFRGDFKYCTTVILLQLIDEGFITVNPIIISCAHHNKGTSASLKKNSDQGTLTPLATARKPSSMAFKRLESDGFSRVFFFWLESDQSKWLILFPHLEDSHVLGEIQVIKRLLLGVVWRFWIFKEKPWKYAAGPWKWENWSNFLPFGSILFEALKKFNWIYWKPPTGPNSQHPHLLDTACRQSIDGTFRHMPNEDIKNSTSGQPNAFRCHLKAEGFCFSPPNTSIHPLQSQWFFRRFPIPKVSQKVSPCPKDDSREMRLNTSGWIASAKLTVIFSSQVGSEFTALMANTGASGTAHWMSGLVIHPEDFTPKWFKKNWPRQSWAMVGKKNTLTPLKETQIFKYWCLKNHFDILHPKKHPGVKKVTVVVSTRNCPREMHWLGILKICLLQLCFVSADHSQHGLKLIKVEPSGEHLLLRHQEPAAGRANTIGKTSVDRWLWAPVVGMTGMARKRHSKRKQKWNSWFLGSFAGGENAPKDREKVWNRYLIRQAYSSCGTIWEL